MPVVRAGRLPCAGLVVYGTILMRLTDHDFSDRWFSRWSCSRQAKRDTRGRGHFAFPRNNAPKENLMSHPAEESQAPAAPAPVVATYVHLVEALDWPPLRCGRPGCRCMVAWDRPNAHRHCPLHDDEHPSLSVRVKGRRVLIYCWVCGRERQREVWAAFTAQVRSGHSPCPCRGTTA